MSRPEAGSRQGPVEPDRDPAHGVDRLLEADEVDFGVVIDLDVENALDRVDQPLLTAFAVECAVDTAVPRGPSDRNPQITGQGDEVDPTQVGVHPGDHDRVGSTADDLFADEHIGSDVGRVDAVPGVAADDEPVGLTGDAGRCEPLDLGGDVVHLALEPHDPGGDEEKGHDRQAPHGDEKLLAVGPSWALGSFGPGQSPPVARRPWSCRRVTGSLVAGSVAPAGSVWVRAMAAQTIVSSSLPGVEGTPIDAAPVESSIRLQQRANTPMSKGQRSVAPAKG